MDVDMVVVTAVRFVATTVLTAAVSAPWPAGASSGALRVNETGGKEIALPSGGAAAGAL
jgi:hypothetical protein